MSRAARIRLGTGLAAAAAFLLLFAAVPGWAGLVLAAAGAGLVGILGERAWARRATPEERRRDLEDRVRNPPS